MQILAALFRMFDNKYQSWMCACTLLQMGGSCRFNTSLLTKLNSRRVVMLLTCSIEIIINFFGFFFTFLLLQVVSGILSFSFNHGISGN